MAFLPYLTPSPNPQYYFSLSTTVVMDICLIHSLICPYPINPDHSKTIPDEIKPDSFVIKEKVSNEFK